MVSMLPYLASRTSLLTSQSSSLLFWLANVSLLFLHSNQVRLRKFSKQEGGVQFTLYYIILNINIKKTYGSGKQGRSIVDRLLSPKQNTKCLLFSSTTIQWMRKVRQECMGPYQSKSILQTIDLQGVELRQEVEIITLSQFLLSASYLSAVD